jgi:hypothetical protein
LIRLLFILLCINLIGPKVGAQYSPLKSDEGLKKDYLKAIESKFKEDKLSVSGPSKSDIIKMYELRYNSNKDLVTREMYIFDSLSQNYLSFIVDQIAQSNDDFDFSDIKPVLNRSPVANAFSVGEGTLVINIGLLKEIKIQDHLVFIICHEIAHYLLEHSNKRIQALFDKTQNEKTARSLKPPGSRRSRSMLSLARLCSSSRSLHTWPSNNGQSGKPSKHHQQSPLTRQSQIPGPKPHKRRNSRQRQSGAVLSRQQCSRRIMPTRIGRHSRSLTTTASRKAAFPRPYSMPGRHAMQSLPQLCRCQSRRHKPPSPYHHQALGA